MSILRTRCFVEFQSSVN